jgi:hypothetical protein
LPYLKYPNVRNQLKALISKHTIILELRFAFGQKHGRKAKCATSDQKLGLNKTLSLLAPNPQWVSGRIAVVKRILPYIKK